MPRFKDSKGREWNLSLSTGMLGKLRRDAGFALSTQTAARQLTEMLADPMQFGAVLWVLVEEQARALAIEPEDFAMAIDGDAIDAATTAFIEACVDFFQRAGTRQAIKAQLPALLKRAEEEVIEAASRMASEHLKKPVGSLLASSASTPAP